MTVPKILLELVIASALESTEMQHHQNLIWILQKKINVTVPRTRSYVHIHKCSPFAEVGEPP